MIYHCFSTLYVANRKGTNSSTRTQYTEMVIRRILVLAVQCIKQDKPHSEAGCRGESPTVYMELYMCTFNHCLTCLMCTILLFFSVEPWNRRGPLVYTVSLLLCAGPQEMEFLALPFFFCFKHLDALYQFVPRKCSQIFWLIMSKEKKLFPFSIIL